ncbi:MAG: hypothetical protein ACOYMD_04810 [Paludibacter sp.]
MKDKFKSFVKPYLSILDNGVFFRKPFSWLYILIAVLSLIAPVYLMYSAINLHVAFNKRENSKVKYEVFMQKFEGLKQNYETAMQNTNQFSNDAQNAYNNYEQAKQNIEYYKNYIEYYPQDYQNAKDQSKQWYASWKDFDMKSKAAQKEYESLKPQYDKDFIVYNQLNNDYMMAIDNYNQKTPQGAFHSSDSKFQSFIALIFFSILVIFIGWINFQIFWNRKSSLQNITKENDEITAIPVVAHFIKTIGESLGTYIGVMGFFTLLIALIFKSCFGIFGLNQLFPISVESLTRDYEMGIPFLLVPLFAGFFTILLFRIIAEGVNLLAVITNNTGNMLEEQRKLTISKAIELEVFTNNIESENKNAEAIDTTND